MSLLDRIFGRDDPSNDERADPDKTMTQDNDSTDDETDTEKYEQVTDDEEEQEEETVTLVEEHEATFDYTEHDAHVVFEDGREEEYTFDSMNKGSDEIVLKDYSDELSIKRTMMGSVRTEPSKVLAFLTIERDKMQTFETTDRRSKTMTEEYVVTDEVPRSEAEEQVEQYSNVYIREDQEDNE